MIPVCQRASSVSTYIGEWSHLTSFGLKLGSSSDDIAERSLKPLVCAIWFGLHLANVGLTWNFSGHSGHDCSWSGERKFYNCMRGDERAAWQMGMQSVIDKAPQSSLHVNWRCWLGSFSSFSSLYAAFDSPNRKNISQWRTAQVSCQS